MILRRRRCCFPCSVSLGASVDSRWLFFHSEYHDCCCYHRHHYRRRRHRGDTISRGCHHQGFQGTVVTSRGWNFRRLYCLRQSGCYCFRLRNFGCHSHYWCCSSKRSCCSSFQSSGAGTITHAHLLLLLKCVHHLLQHLLMLLLRPLLRCLTIITFPLLLLLM